MRLLTLCRYEDENVLRRSDIDIDSTSYIAISHIWAQAEWHSNLAGIGWEVLASTQKARFLTQRLPSLVGTEYFWMDILCVDQRSFEARVGVVAHIPAIYRGARKTIVVREAGGISECCAQAIGDYRSWREDAAQNFATHIQTAHLNGLVESWFDRLWPLQEAILSDRLQFTVCETETADRTETEWDAFTHQIVFRRIFDGLTCIARAWITYGIEEDGSELEYREFIEAFLKNDSVTRREHTNYRHRKRPLLHDFIIHINSLRITSKPRDFILAILPQYGWYSPPNNLKHMEFGELWVDCCRQAHSAGYGFNPSIIKGLTEVPNDDHDSHRPSQKIPVPSCLGDFVKLFGCTGVQDEQVWGTLVGSVEINEIRPNNMGRTLEIIEQTMAFSRSSWALAHRGELSVHGMFPTEQSLLAFHVKLLTAREKRVPDMNESQRLEFFARKERVLKEYEAEKANPNFYEIESIKTLNAMWAGVFEEDNSARVNWAIFKRYLLDSDPPFYQETMLRLAALISCDIGISALSWSKPLLRPVQTEVGGYETLLLATSACDPESEDERYLCVQRGTQGKSGRDVVLIKASNGYVVGKFPDLLGDKMADTEAKVARLSEIYPPENILVCFAVLS